MHAHEQMRALRERWAVTRERLQAARALLPLGFAEDDAGTIAGYEQFLAHNELGLAFEELMAVGTANTCSAEFWEQLASVAASMSLHEFAARCQTNAKAAEASL